MIAIPTTTGSGMKLRPTSEFMHLPAARYCREPAAAMPQAIDSDIRGLFLSDDGVGHLWT